MNGTDRTGEPRTVDVVWGTAEGATALSAFDRALAAGGVGDYNLVRLSSVLPAGASVRESGTVSQPWPTGEIVAAVVADATSERSGERLVAGLGWGVTPSGGVFVEHAAGSREACRTHLERGVADAMAHRGWDWDGHVGSRLVAHDVESAGAAVVVAVFGPLALVG